MSGFTVLVTDLDEVPHIDGYCLSCDERMPSGPFLRHMAGADNEAAPTGTVGDECRPCAERYGRNEHFENYDAQQAADTEELRRLGIKDKEHDMDWLARMNWSFLEDDVAEKVWDSARKRYFEEDEELQTAFTEALREQGIEVPDPEA